MKLLAIDTSTKYLSAAIAEDNSVLAAFRDTGQLRHSALLIPTIDKLLKKCHFKLKDIDTIALSIGPGSFTGLRIGVAACKAINLTLKIPIIAVPTLDVIAYNFATEKEDILCPIVDAKKGKLYACFYKNNLLSCRPAEEVALKRIANYMLIDINNLLKKIKKPTLFFADGVNLYAEKCRKNPYIHISTKEWHPKAEVVAKLAFKKAQKRQFANPDRLIPMYLHSKYCQVKNDK